MSENTVIDPLLSTCKCSGGVRFIHFKCLKQWLETKQVMRTGNNLKSYYWHTFECEICKHRYPYVFKAHNRKYHLIDIEKPAGDHLILESLGFDTCSSRMIYVFYPNAGVPATYKMGRGNDQDVRVTSDISVSRCHSLIKYKDGQFLLEDNLSKFGTLVLIRNQLEI